MHLSSRFAVCCQYEVLGHVLSSQSLHLPRFAFKSRFEPRSGTSKICSLVIQIHRNMESVWHTMKCLWDLIAVPFFYWSLNHATGRRIGSASRALNVQRVVCVDRWHRPDPCTMEKLKELEARWFNDDGNCSAIFPEERDLTTRKKTY